ncbi:MAG: MBL fold metallo-hydrolase [Candidatus Omnitrophica bacterium]|nr:MBL fold metallo-hydrolase [Candidatus Omnitrophota bacterium]
MSRKFTLKRFVVGLLGTNCYLVADALTKEACLIDPGSGPYPIKNFISKEGLDLKFIINTHGHGDHIGANAFFDVPIFIHKLDKDFLTNPGMNMSRMFMPGIVSPGAERLLEEGDILNLGGLELKILHTPGHTPGSVSVVLDGVVFTGDALFAGSVGRTDFEYGDQDSLIRSITQKLFTLKDDTIVYPGHGGPSTIGEEKKSNPFFS